MDISKHRPHIQLFFTVIILSTMFTACNRKTDENAPLKINNYSLSKTEFNEMLSETESADASIREKQAFLDNIIRRKLILQEAQRLGLDKQKDFLKSVENFWEQSLLKVMIDRKVKELSENVTITDQEVSSAYKKWVDSNPVALKPLSEVREMIKWQLKREKQEALLSKWIDSLKTNASITINKKELGLE